MCLSADFGDSKVFQKHNFYDVSKRKALQAQNVAKHLVLETIASPGTTHYHRLDLIDFLYYILSRSITYKCNPKIKTINQI